MSNVIDWYHVATQIGTLDETSERGGDDVARRALELIVGEDQLRGAVDYYVTHEPGSELVRSILHLLHPGVAMQRCYELYHSQVDIEVRRSAVELLRVVADRRALKWIGEFLDDRDMEIQGWGIGVLEHLAFSGLAFAEECEMPLRKAEQHAHAYVREIAARVRQYFQAASGEEY